MSYSDFNLKTVKSSFNLEIIKESLPKKAARLVKGWCLEHQEELMAKLV